MSKAHRTQEPADAEPTTDDLITGPWTEPIEQGGANYYKCADCGRESLRRGDLKNSDFHAPGCEGRQ